VPRSGWPHGPPRHAPRISQLQVRLRIPAAHPLHTAAVAVARRVAAETNGVVDIEVLGASQLGGDNNLMSQVRSGGPDFYAGAGSVFATVFPIASIWAMGFAFNYAEVWAAVDGELGDRVRAGARGAGLVPFDVMWDNGFRQISTGARPVNGAGDLKGVKIRVPVSPSLISLFQNLDASPVSLNFGEVYTALQTHLVDAQESPLSIFDLDPISRGFSCFRRRLCLCLRHICPTRRNSGGRSLIWSASDATRLTSARVRAHRPGDPQLGRAG